MYDLVDILNFLNYNGTYVIISSRFTYKLTPLSNKFVQLETYFDDVCSSYKVNLDNFHQYKRMKKINKFVSNI